MSHTYHFVCIDCAHVIDVGKLIDQDESGSRFRVRFAGWRDQATCEWLEGARLWEVLERWFILHRGHEIRLVPEPFLESTDPDGELTYCDAAAEVLEQEIQPLPDDEEDARCLPADVQTRLRSHVGRARMRRSRSKVMR